MTASVPSPGDGQDSDESHNDTPPALSLDGPHETPHPLPDAVEAAAEGVDS